MVFITDILFVVLAYLMGSIPTGWILVKLVKGKDIRNIASGRTGATNTLRAAGFWPALVTWIADVLKAAIPVWAVRMLMPGNYLLEALTPLAAILGHNYSIFLPERTPQGGWRLRGGAGGAPCIGGIFALWPPAILIVVPIGGFILYFIGYASVGTISVAIMATLILGYRAWMGVSSWELLIYGIGSIVLLGWALRPNFKRLLQGTERIVGYRARKLKQ